MEENKKSKKGLVLGIIAVLIILGLVGYICYDKGLIFKSDKEVKEEKEKENKKEVKLDLKNSIVVKAEDILNSIIANSTYGEISDSVASSVFNEKELDFKKLNDNQKMLLTIRNSNANIYHTCGTSLTIETVQADISADKLVNSSIFEDSSYIDSFKSGKVFLLDEFGLRYDKSLKSFAAVNGICGREGPMAFDSLKITSAKKINDEAIVNINYAFFVPEGDMDIKYVIKETHDRKAKSIGDASDLKLDENHYPIVDENKCGKYQVKFKIDEDNLKLYIESIKKVS